MRMRTKSKGRQVIVWGGLAASWSLLAAATVRGDKSDVVTYVPPERDDPSSVQNVATSKIDFSFEGSYKQVTQPEILSTPQWGYVAPAEGTMSAPRAQSDTASQPQAVRPVTQPVAQPAQAVAAAPPVVQPSAIRPAFTDGFTFNHEPLRPPAAPAPRNPAPPLPITDETAMSPRFSEPMAMHKSDVSKAIPHTTYETSIEELTGGERFVEEVITIPEAAAPPEPTAVPENQAERLAPEAAIAAEVSARPSLDQLSTLALAAPIEPPAALQVAAMPAELAGLPAEIARTCALDANLSSLAMEPVLPIAVHQADSLLRDPLAAESDSPDANLGRPQSGHLADRSVCVADA
ncbi:MAG: hypothetical protein F6J97_18480 [Leptolyngbya sp. SIO4C1]|nr:hypothetical protein [Leptolyngbya sp. SIO4C1]